MWRIRRSVGGVWEVVGEPGILEEIIKFQNKVDWQLVKEFQRRGEEKDIPRKTRGI